MGLLLIFIGDVTGTSDDGTIPSEPKIFHVSFPLTIGNRVWITGGEYSSKKFHQIEILIKVFSLNYRYYPKLYLPQALTWPKIKVST